MELGGSDKARGSAPTLVAAPRRATIRIRTGSWIEASELPADFAVDALAATPSSASGVDASLVGRVIDHFHVRSVIGRGGMGTVYLAHDQSLDRAVALKFLRPDLAEDPRFVAHLLDEARAQARLQHPNVVTIHFIGRHAEVPYLAMEYVRGESLADRLAKHGPVAWPQALEFVIDAARALRAAHQAGIIHRDVKPSNLILASTDHRGGSEPEVVVADFGLAAPAASPERGSGGFIGTPHYASPEQIDGNAADHRSDIYALGVTLFELVTGRRPFDAELLAEVFARHRSPERPALPAEAAPPRLRALVADMVALDPAARPQTWDEVLTRLEAARPAPADAAGPAPRALALGIDLGVLAALAGFVRLLPPLAVRPIAAHTTAFALFAAYHVACHRLWRRTIGKRLVGLAVRGLDRAPSTGALIARFAVAFWAPIVALAIAAATSSHLVTLGSLGRSLLVRLGHDGRVPALAATGHALLAALPTPGPLGAALWLAGFAMVSASPRQRALHDLVARTRVVFDRPERRRAR